MVDGKVKIVRNETIGEYVWDDPDNDSATYDGDNNWNNSTLKTYLNTDYYASLSANAKAIISPSTWYLGGTGNSTNHGVTKTLVYDLERNSEKVYDTNPDKIENTNIGLMYPSDCAFSAMETENCLSNTTLQDYAVCGLSNWLVRKFPKELTTATTYEWLITPSYAFEDLANIFDIGGAVSGTYHGYVHESQVIRPTLYLTSNIKWKGAGTKESPYKIFISQ